MSNRYLIFLAKGGMTHTLNSLGNSLYFARESDRQLVAATRAHLPFSMDLVEILNLDRSGIISPPNWDELQIYYTRFDERMPEHVKSVSMNPEKNGTYCIPGIAELFGRANYTDLPHAFPENAALAFTTGSLDRARVPPALAGLGGLKQLLPLVSLNSRVASGARDTGMMDPYVGVHYRNTDYRTDLGAILEALRREVEMTGLSTVYWATDDPASVAVVRSAFPGLNIHTGANRIDIRKTGIINAHHTPQNFLEEHGISRYQLHIDFFRDIYALSHAQSFIRSPHSSIGSLVNLLREQPDLRSSFFSEQV